MSDQLYQVELTASFLERLNSIESFLLDADAGFVLDKRPHSSLVTRRIRWHREYPAIVLPMQLQKECRYLMSRSSNVNSEHRICVLSSDPFSVF